MKKLLIAAVTMSVAASAFAVTVYDYKASVKYVDMKRTTVTVDGDKYTVDMKVIKSASLTGYLINEDCCNLPGKTYGYLVVANKASSADKGVPKILPADLMSKIWWTKENATKGETEGYLFAGLGKFDNPYTWDATAGTYTGSLQANYGFGKFNSFGTRFLFGMYNDATIVDPVSGLVDFYDAWLDASGFGKATVVEGKQSGCGLGTVGGACLDSLSGSVIGGHYICFENVTLPWGETWEEVLCADWLGTTDVITGTWSIKRTTKVVAQELTIAELAIVPAGRLALFPYVKGAANTIKAGTDLTLYPPLMDTDEAND